MPEGVSQDECYNRMQDLGGKMDEVLTSQGEVKGLLEGVGKRLDEGAQTMRAEHEHLRELTTKVGELRGGLVWTAWCWVKRRINGGG